MDPLRGRWPTLAAILAAAGGCGDPGGSGAPSIDAPPPGSSSSQPVLVEPVIAGVPHDCSGLGPASAPTCEGGARPHDGLTAVSDRLHELGAMHRPPPASYWAAARAGVDHAAGLSADSLSQEERILVQNGALHVAVAAHDRGQLALARDAIRVVRRLAFASPLPETIEPDPALDGWLGARAGWVERTRPGQPLMHESMSHQTRMWRLVRSGSLRTNFSLLIAVSDQGVPFVTSVVGGVEVRRGRGPEAPACLLELAPPRVRCRAAAGLEPVADLASLPQSHFLRRDRGQLQCQTCHSSTTEEEVMGFGVRDLAPEEVEAELETRRKLVLGSLLRRFKPLWDEAAAQ